MFPLWQAVFIVHIYTYGRTWDDITGMLYIEALVERDCGI